MNGTMIHIGTIVNTDNGSYTVKSITESPMETPPMTAIDDAEYSAGDRVCYFLFDNGFGKIICAYTGVN